MTSVTSSGLSLRWLVSLGAMLVGVIFLTNWPTYQYLVLGGSIPLIYYLIPGLLVILVVAARPGLLLQWMRDPLVIWFVVYVLAGLIWLLASGSLLDEENRLWRRRLLAFLMFLASFTLASEGKRAPLANVVILCAVVASVNNWLDFLFPFHFVPRGLEFSNPGRGAGLFINANQAGTAVIAITVAALPFLDRRLRGLALLIMLFGVYPTFSRSAFIFGVLVIVLAVLLGQINKRQLTLMVVLAPVLLVVGMSLHELGGSSGEINLRNVEQRIDFFRSGGEALDDSADERRYVALLAWRMFADSPIVGNGIGSTLVEGHGRGTHNMYLMLAAEQGVAGVLLYLMLIVLVLRRGWQLFKRGVTRRDQDVGTALICMATLFALIGLFSHTLLEEPSIMFLLAFLLASERNAPRNDSASNALYAKSRKV